MNNNLLDICYVKYFSSYQCYCSSEYVDIFNKTDPLDTEHTNPKELSFSDPNNGHFVIDIGIVVVIQGFGK